MIRLTREQVRSVDRLAVEEFAIPSIVLMENAARSFVDAIGDLLPVEGPVAVLCGGGNNGGDGLAIVRHLHNRGHDVSIVLTVPMAKLRGDALANWRIVEAMKLKVRIYQPGREDAAIAFVVRSGLVIDALFGTGLSRPIPAGTVALVEACNRMPSHRRVVAVDVPSGLDCDTGEPLGACIRAMRTVTFAAEKVGFTNPHAKAFLGKVVVGDIGCPRELIERVSHK